MRMLRIQEVIRITGLSRMTIYRFEKIGQFPNRRRVGRNSVRWLDADIDLWMTSRPVARGVASPMTAPSLGRRNNTKQLP